MHLSGTLDSVCCLGVPLEKTAGGTRCGDPGDISVLITDTTGERFCECSLAANGLCLESFLAQCSCTHESPSTPMLSSKVYMLPFPRREDPGINQILELLQTGNQVMSRRTDGHCQTCRPELVPGSLSLPVFRLNLWSTCFSHGGPALGPSFSQSWAALALLQGIVSRLQD